MPTIASVAARPSPTEAFSCGANPGPPPDNPTGPVLDTSKPSNVSSFGLLAPVSDSAAYAVDVTCERFRAAATTDGGNTWYETLGKLPTGGFGNFAFVNPTTGIAFGHEVGFATSGNDLPAVRTTDGGAHWTVMDGLTGSVFGAATEGESVWALSVSADQSGAVSLWESDDAGASWRQSSSPPLLPAGVGAGALARVDQRTAFALGKSLPGRPSAGAITSTSDAGATWSVRADPCPQAPREDLATVTATSLWAACGYGGPAGGPVEVYRSSDGAATWKLVSATPAGDSTPAYLFRMAVLDDQRAFLALGGGAGVMSTADGGKTWRAALPVVGSLTPVDVVFASPTEGWALAAGGIWRTSDGASWRRVNQVMLHDLISWPDGLTATGQPAPELKQGLVDAGVPISDAVRRTLSTHDSQIGVDIVAYPTGTALSWHRALEVGLGQIGDGSVQTVDVAGERLEAFHDVDGRARLLWVDDQFAMVFGELPDYEGADLKAAAFRIVSAIHNLGIGVS